MSGRIAGPSIACISIGINSRSTKVRTVFLRSLSSSGSSKSMVVLSCGALSDRIWSKLSARRQADAASVSVRRAGIFPQTSCASDRRLRLRLRRRLRVLEHHSCRHLLRRAPRGRLAVDAVEDFLDGAEVALERLGSELARDESQDIVSVAVHACAGELAIERVPHRPRGVSALGRSVIDAHGTSFGWYVD